MFVYRFFQLLDNVHLIVITFIAEEQRKCDILTLQ